MAKPTFDEIVGDVVTEIERAINEPLEPNFLPIVLKTFGMAIVGLTLDAVNTAMREIHEEAKGDRRG